MKTIITTTIIANYF